MSTVAEVQVEPPNVPIGKQHPSGFFPFQVSQHFKREDGVEQDCALVMAYIVGLLYFVGGVIMLYIHRIHQAVFRTNYQLAKESERPYMQVVQDLRSRNSPNTPRV